MKFYKARDRRTGYIDSAVDVFEDFSFYALHKDKVYTLIRFLQYREEWEKVSNSSNGIFSICIYSTHRVWCNQLF